MADTSRALRLVQILLPLADNDGRPFGEADFAPVLEEITRRCGGLTAHVRAPAAGFWTGGGRTVPTQDDVVLIEAMDDSFDRSYWAALRGNLEERLRQEDVVIRVLVIERV